MYFEGKCQMYFNINVLNEGGTWSIIQKLYVQICFSEGGGLKENMVVFWELKGIPQESPRDRCLVFSFFR